MKRFTFILALVMSMLSFTNAKAEKLQIRLAESTIQNYSTFYTNYVYDGRYNTKFWSNGAPGVDYTFTVYLTSSANIGDIKLYFANGDLPTDGAVIEVNENNSGNWVQVGESLNGIQANDVVTRNAGGIYTKQIRLRFTQASAVWFQLLEFEVYEYEATVQERTISVTASPAEGGTVTVNGAAGAVTAEGDIVLAAEPAYGYKFVRWTLGGEEVSTSAEYVDNTEGNKEYVANFEKITNIDEWYASIAKPTFGKAGNTTFLKAATLAGDVNTEVAGIQAVAGQACVTNVIEVAAGAEFDLNITYQLNWGDLAIYQIDNDGATKEYGYYYGSWEPNGSTEKVVQYLEADERISVSEVVDGACTVTYPITINENHNPGDVIVVRAITGVINNAKNSAFEQNIVEGGYVDFLFVVTEAVAAESYTLTVGESGYATLFLDFNAAIPESVEAYTVTKVNTGYVTLTQVEGVLPANTGVIVKAGKGNYNFVASTDGVANVEGNLLKGSVDDENIEGEAYVLGVVDGAVGLYKALASGTSWLNNANKAYLPASEVPNKTVAFYGFDWDGTTGIEQITDSRVQSTVIYDLTGRRVEEITAPGVYIVGGKKVLVK